jgi:hypothetical protein
VRCFGLLDEMDWDILCFESELLASEEEPSSMAARQTPEQIQALAGERLLLQVWAKGDRVYFCKSEGGAGGPIGDGCFWWEAGPSERRQECLRHWFMRGCLVCRANREVGVPGVGRARRKAGEGDVYKDNRDLGRAIPLQVWYSGFALNTAVVWCGCSGQ